MNRRDLLKFLAAAPLASGALRLYAAPATNTRAARRLHARRLRRGEFPRPVHEQLLLRSAAEHRGAAAGRRSEFGIAAGCGLGLASVAAQLSPRPLPERPARVRAVRRNGRPFAQPFRDAGHDRARPGARPHAQLPVGFSEPARRRALERRDADRFHRPAAGRFPRRAAGPEHGAAIAEQSPASTRARAASSRTCTRTRRSARR